MSCPLKDIEDARCIHFSQPIFANSQMMNATTHTQTWVATYTITSTMPSRMANTKPHTDTIHIQMNSRTGQQRYTRPHPIATRVHARSTCNAPLPI